MRDMRAFVSTLSMVTLAAAGCVMNGADSAQEDPAGDSVATTEAAVGMTCYLANGSPNHGCPTGTYCLYNYIPQWPCGSLPGGKASGTCVTIPTSCTPRGDGPWNVCSCVPGVPGLTEFDNSCYMLQAQGQWYRTAGGCP